MQDWFDDRKAAQVAAFFCGRHGGTIDVLKLVKLIYIADREFMRECGFPITNDRHVSMDHGPANSLTLGLISGNSESENWSDLVAPREGYQVGLAREIEEDDLDELSEAELDTLEAVWGDFGHMGKWEIRDWTHLNCPEWEDPNGSSNPIPHERTLKLLGVANAKAFADDVLAMRYARSMMTRLRAQIAD